MVFEILKASDKPQNPFCVVDVDPQGKPSVNCDVNPNMLRQLMDKDYVCIIEFNPKEGGKPYSMCGQGKDIVAHIFQVKL